MTAGTKDRMNLLIVKMDFLTIVPLFHVQFQLNQPSEMGQIIKIFKSAQALASFFLPEFCVSDSLQSLVGVHCLILFLVSTLPSICVLFNKFSVKNRQVE